MKEEYNNENLDLELDVNVNELDEQTQNKIRRAIEEIGLDKKINLETIFIKDEEEMEEVNLFEVISDEEVDDNNNNSVSIEEEPLSKPTELKPIDNSEIRRSLLSNEVKYYNTIEYIHLSQLVEISKSINFFDNPDDEHFLDLSQSVENFGIIEPLIVIKDQSSQMYTVVCGNSRLGVLKTLYANSRDEKYLKVPCILLDESTDPSIIQGIVISTNMSYRRISRENLIKSILILDEILRKNKKYRNEINVTEAIAERAGVSRSTVNNYRALKDLSPKALDLVYKKHMNLHVAGLLARKDHEMQDRVIEVLGNNINDVPKVKALLEGPAKRIYDEEVNDNIQETWEKKIERTKRIIPHMTQIVINVVSTGVKKCLDAVAELKKQFAIEYMTTKDNEINQFFKVKVNDYHMEQYVRKGFVPQGLLDKIKSTVFNDLIKLDYK